MAQQAEYKSKCLDPPTVDSPEGTILPCKKCGRKVKWVTKTYGGKYNPSTTVRNADDENAHNVKVGDKNWVCSTVTGFAENTRSVVQQATETKVVWENPGEFTDDEQLLLSGLKRMRVLAYKDAKDVHPDMNENSNTFGQIVNAGITHLTQLAKVKAIKEIKD